MLLSFFLSSSFLNLVGICNFVETLTLSGSVSCLDAFVGYVSEEGKLLLAHTHEKPNFSTCAFTHKYDLF